LTLINQSVNMGVHVVHVIIIATTSFANDRC
jgi:hypothetical protein